MKIIGIGVTHQCVEVNITVLIDLIKVVVGIHVVIISVFQSDTRCGITTL
jgi:hypothetical protein